MGKALDICMIYIIIRGWGDRDGWKIWMDGLIMIQQPKHNENTTHAKFAANSTFQLQFEK